MPREEAEPRKQKIRFAVVGCGRISRNHFAAIAEHAPNAELVAVCDVDSPTLERAHAETGAAAFASLQELLATSDAGVVVLATPSGLHAEQAVAVAESGRHVVTEKPMATRLGDAEHMVRACEEAGVRLFVVKQNRHNPTLRLLKQAIDGGRFGRIHLVIVNVLWHRPQAYYDSAAWRGTWAFDGGAFMNQASHYIDLMSWLIGPVESVQALTATLGRSIEVEDTGVLSVRWRSGALGSLNVTMLTHSKNLEASVTVLGERGTVRLGGVAVNEVQHWEFADEHDDAEAVRRASYETPSVYGFGHARYYENVMAVLRGEAEPETDGREGIKSLEIVAAAYRSVRDGRRVALPLQDR